MPSKMTIDPVAPNPPLQNGWPMVESVPTGYPKLQEKRPPSPGADEHAHRLAETVEARTRSPRANGGGDGESALDRATARALVEAGYMPLGDYIALYGDEVAAEAAQQVPRSGQVTAHFSAAYPRRQTYRAINVTLAKSVPRPIVPKRRGRR